MTITYHSGKRLQGIESDRTITTNFDGAGGTESTNGAKSVFTFTSVGSTNFVLTGSGDVEYLIVAGGGGGGKTSAGGGGAGGMKTGTFTNLAAGTYSVVVGAGGAGGGGSGHGVVGTNGGDSSINSITSTGGGGGAGYPNAGGNGGSGGGCAENKTNNGTGISGQGYDGGDSSHENSGAGGGGAGAVGNGTTSTGTGGGGLGGVGVSSSISGSAYYYSAGGSGCNNTSTGASGKGGVGSGNDNSNAGDATGYGSGGGGARDSGHGGGNGGDGYQGIVILSLTSTSTTTYPLNSNTSPAGSRFEETDTRKIYTRLAGSVAGSTYDSKSFDTGSQAASVRALSFSADGTKMYALDSHTNDTIYQYTLSTAWDISTASYASKSFGIATQDNQPHGIEFKSDGTKMYLSGVQNYKIYQYSLSTAWDISTSSYDSVSLSVSGQDTTPTGVTFKSDGTKIYLSGSTNDKIYQYSLSSAWDLSTASYDSVYLDVSSQDNQLNDLQLNSDGTKLYIIGNQNDNVCQYSLSTAWDLSTASYDSKSFNVTSQEEFPEGLFLSSDDTKFYIIGRQNDTVFQYSIGTTSWKEKGTT